MMGYTVAFANQKGGTGKTTTVANLAGVLAESGQKVLMVDFDPQANLTVAFGIQPHSLKHTLYDVLAEDVAITDIIQPVRENLDIAPSYINLSTMELQLVSEMNREYALRRAIEPTKSQYEYILVDCTPSLGLLTVNALAAANGLVIPAACDYLSSVGVMLLLNTISRMKRKGVNSGLQLLGVLPTRYDTRTNNAREVLEDMREELGTHVRVFETSIRESVRFKEAPIAGKTIIEYRSSHPGAEDYRNFAKEFVNVTQTSHS